LHRWTYGLDGKLLGAPHFEQDPCLNLRNYPVQSWQGLLFEGNGRNVTADLATLGMACDFDFSGYVYGHAHLHECDYNWKTFIEVYLEDYHVGPFHPGLGQFVTCEDLRWELGAAPLGANGGCESGAGPSRLAGLSALAGPVAAVHTWQGSSAWGRVADLLPDRDGRVVPAGTGGLRACSHAAPARR
jgi:phenylpropionate dioxygenase-like ring-hydroxylating dioxygenase large terminal subunit